eukprot:2915624-Amphidinium_carterae.2
MHAQSNQVLSLSEEWHSSSSSTHQDQRRFLSRPHITSYHHQTHMDQAQEKNKELMRKSEVKMLLEWLREISLS